MSIDPLAAENVAEALQKFADGQSGLISAYILVEQDSKYEYVFVPEQPSSVVENLLEMWGISPATVSRVRPYKALGVAQLKYSTYLRPHTR